MPKYILKRVLISILILFFVAFIIYTMMRCLPTSYIEAKARERSMQPNQTLTYEEILEQLSASYGMDKGIVLGFFSWLGRALTGNFGESWHYTIPVVDKFQDVIWIHSLWAS